MRAGLIGFPFSGKTTIFQILTGKKANKKEENIGTIKVPDERVDFLSDIYKPKKTIYAEFVISDYNVPSKKESIIAPSIKTMLQKVELLIIIIRDFSSLFSNELQDPISGYKRLREELTLTDFMIIEKRLERLEKENRNSLEIPVLKKLAEMLEENIFPKQEDFTENEYQLISNYSFLSLKKRIFLINQEEDTSEISEELRKCLDDDNEAYFSISATLESELNELSEEECKSFLESFGLEYTMKEHFIKTAFTSMELISFLTIGKDEVRAWQIKKDTIALNAAEKIHSDISRGFIRAEIVSFEDFKKYGSENECKKAGVYSLKGKTYIMQDGDITSFRFNV